MKNKIYNLIKINIINYLKLYEKKKIKYKIKPFDLKIKNKK
jgi:hypothetical protein